MSVKELFDILKAIANFWLLEQFNTILEVVKDDCQEDTGQEEAADENEYYKE